MSEILIPEYENYSINNLGQVKNLKTGKIKKYNIDRKGYYFVSLWKNNKEKNFKVHKLLAKLFLGINGIVDHIDGCPTNNSFCNLREATVSQNSCNRKNVKGYTVIYLKKKGKLIKHFEAKIMKHGKKYFNISTDLYKVILWRCAKEIELFREFARKTRKCSVKILSDN